MVNCSAAEAVYIIPTASWGSRLAVSQNHRRLYLIKPFKFRTLCGKGVAYNVPALRGYLD